MTTNLASAGPSVGAHAPDVFVTGLPGRGARGEPRVIAFAHAWSLTHERPEALRAIRAQLRGLGAELLVLSQRGVWSVHADDAAEEIRVAGDRLASEIALAAMQYGVREGHDAVFVIDDRGIVRFAHRPEASMRPVCQALENALARSGDALHARATYDTKERMMFTRREWTATCLVVGCATAFLSGCKQQRKASEHRAEADLDVPGDVEVTLTINGKHHTLAVDPRASLLDVLRERLGLTGTKKGCDAGQCGACTVLAGGKRVTSCLTLAVMAQGRDITTIEGLAQGGVLHPMQQAFIDCDGLQCGYCTPGQILSAVALLGEGHAITDAEVREQMSGNLCRCGAYPNIVSAIQLARRARG
jgi:xanthine dehydrogenase YagT iron-sulfur-binding subunit